MKKEKLIYAVKRVKKDNKNDFEYICKDVSWHEACDTFKKSLKENDLNEFRYDLIYLDYYEDTKILIQEVNRYNSDRYLDFKNKIKNKDEKFIIYFDEPICCYQNGDCKGCKGNLIDKCCKRGDDLKSKYKVGDVVYTITSTDRKIVGITEFKVGAVKEIFGEIIYRLDRFECMPFHKAEYEINNNLKELANEIKNKYPDYEIKII